MRIDRLWQPLAAGLCGSAAHFTLMYLKSRTGLLPSFQPYQDLQLVLGELTGGSVHPIAPWALSFLNGAVVLGFVFARTYRRLPGRSGAAKGFVFGMLAWFAMGLLFFPFLGRGLFAIQAGGSLAPAAFSLLMMLTYAITMGIAYSVLRR